MLHFTMYDLRLLTPSTFILAGSSNCGKSTMALNIIRSAPVLFTDPRCSENVIFFYNQWQNSYEIAAQEKIIHKWINAVPTQESVEEHCSMYKDDGGSIIVIDDFANDVGRDVVTIFSMLSHHLNLVVLLITQNLFSKNKVFRDISLNSTYVVLFKNARDQSSITNFAKQYAPGHTSFIVKSFRAATRKAYSYMLFDCHQQTEDWIRVRSKILPHELPMVIWMPKDEH